MTAPVMSRRGERLSMNVVARAAASSRAAIRLRFESICGPERAHREEAELSSLRFFTKK
jgi:hypothetical protein